jgi:hypothetical protein
MQLSDAQIQALLEPFDYGGIVEKRESDGQLLVRHEYARARLSEIFGPLGWSEQTLELTEVPTGDDGQSVNKYVAYRARVRVTIHPNGAPAAYWDGAGAWGQGRDVREKKTYIWDLHSDCMNGALSVAFLRATKNLGAQFGLPLYSQDRPVFNARFYLPYQPPVDDPTEPMQHTLDHDTEGALT